MKNPPDFVMYVVMVKVPGSDKFDPWWSSTENGWSYSVGFQNKKQARESKKHAEKLFGKGSAYVQQYGPIS